MRAAESLAAKALSQPKGQLYNTEKVAENLTVKAHIQHLAKPTEYISHFDHEITNLQDQATTLTPQSPLEIIEDVLKVIKTPVLIGNLQNIKNSCATAGEASTNTATTMSKSKLQKERRLTKSLKRSARSVPNSSANIFYKKTLFLASRRFFRHPYQYDHVSHLSSVINDR